MLTDMYTQVYYNLYNNAEMFYKVIKMKFISTISLLHEYK